MCIRLENELLSFGDDRIKILPNRWNFFKISGYNVDKQYNANIRVLFQLILKDVSRFIFYCSLYNNVFITNIIH